MFSLYGYFFKSWFYLTRIRRLYFVYYYAEEMEVDNQVDHYSDVFYIRCKDCAC